MKEVTIFKDRKIKTQQKIIDNLKAENSALKEELDLLKVELELEKNIPKDTYESAKKLITETQLKKSEYEKLIEQAKNAKQEYDKLSKELKELKAQYNKEMKKFFKGTKEEFYEIALQK